MLSVIALGGNALMHKGENAKDQAKNAAKAAAKIVPLSKSRRLIITHGNGFQIGSIMIRVHEALGKAYSIPLYIGVAESEGEIGYVIQQSLTNEFARRKMKKMVASIITQVLVDSKDRAFRNPTKPVGPYYMKKEADKIRRQGIRLTYDKRGGYRVVVPSPRPLKIIEAGVIRKLARDNVMVIAAGGGGVPVIKKGKRLQGVDAVIDKDYASLCLAKSIGAKELIMLTDVDCAYLNYRKKGQKALGKLRAKEAEKYMKEGHFGEGSMKPKMQAAIKFARYGGRALITSPEKLHKALRGKAGTLVAR